MNRTRLLLIGFVALALGAIVSFAVYRTLQTRAGGDTPPGVEVVVAANDIPVGAKVEERRCETGALSCRRSACQPLSSENLRRGPRRDPAHCQGRIFPAQQTGWRKCRIRACQSLIPPGMRAVSVRVNEVIGVAGFVVPGTRVDVLLTGNPTGAQRPANHHRPGERRGHRHRPEAGAQHRRRTAIDAGHHSAGFSR